MRGSVPSMAPFNTPYRATPEPEGDSQSSSSNSPARADFEESDFYAGYNDSESSLGVPTFQDMALSLGTCEPAVNRLPAEVLINIFSRLSHPQDLLSSTLVSKKWGHIAVTQLWHRPACTTWPKHRNICGTLSDPKPYYLYRDFIKRLNLATLADEVNDGSVQPLSVCTKVERLTLTMCHNLTDSGLTGLITGSENLLALDISVNPMKDSQITETSMFALAENCKRLQGLNISFCRKISNEAMIKVAQNCRHIKRLKLNDCDQLEDAAIIAFAKNCPNILEIDLHQCRQIGNQPVTDLLSYGASLRELRLASCDLITDEAFLNLPVRHVYENLRILDLTSCSRLTDAAIEKIIDVAPRLRNLVFAKCRNLTNAAVHAISKLGKNLHYLHLGHCGQITDEAVIKLVQSCNRIRYIDLGCCTHLTDLSVTMLATLPKLRRIGLVKCSNITDDSVYALSAPQRTRIVERRPGEEMARAESSLERVHLSYCTNLTLKSIVVLLNNCHRLTHLSLTGVQAFLRDDLEAFCREAPSEFTEHQRNVFCVFSGQGVINLRKYLNESSDPSLQAAREGGVRRGHRHQNGNITTDDDHTMTGTLNVMALNGGDDDADADGDEDLEDGDVSQNFDGAPS